MSCLTLVLLEVAREEEVLAVVFPRQPERHLSNLTILLLTLSSKPFWSFCFYSSLVVAQSLGLLPFVQSFGLVFGCLHAWDHQGNAVVGCALDVLPLLMRYDGWPGCHSYEQPFAPHRVPSETTAGDSFNNKTWTNMSKSHKLSLLLSKWAVAGAVIITDGSIDFRVVCCSSGLKSLLLIIWSDAPSPQWFVSLSTLL